MSSEMTERLVKKGKPGHGSAAGPDSTPAQATARDHTELKIMTCSLCGGTDVSAAHACDSQRASQGQGDRAGETRRGAPRARWGGAVRLMRPTTKEVVST
eukprot:Tamp_31744.p2 GENE.Tamp_31744~~Tamp_31744.p2  ORF type:complete len:100 (+),score=10.00 Tamp_31744:298-597(+)